MQYLQKLDPPEQVTGTVVELADGRAFRLDRQGEDATVGHNGVLTVVTYEDDRIGLRRHVRRYSPTAWVSVDVTLDPEPPPGIDPNAPVGLGGLKSGPRK